MYVCNTSSIYIAAFDKSLQSCFSELAKNVNKTCQSYAVLNKKVFNFFLKMAKEPANVIGRGRLTVSQAWTSNCKGSVSGSSI